MKLTFKPTSTEALDAVSVSIEEIGVILNNTPAIFIAKDIRKLYNSIDATTPNADYYGAPYVRDLIIIAKVWLAGRTQGIREERARRKEKA